MKIRDSIDYFYSTLIYLYGQIVDRVGHERHPIPAGAWMLYPFAKKSQFYRSACELFLRSPKIRARKKEANFLMGKCLRLGYWRRALSVAPFASADMQEQLIKRFIGNGMKNEAVAAANIAERLITSDEWEELKYQAYLTYDGADLRYNKRRRPLIRKSSATRQSDTQAGLPAPSKEKQTLESEINPSKIYIN